MKEFGVKSKNANLAEIGPERVAFAYWNLSVPELVEETLDRKQGRLTDTGALACDTGEFTGRSNNQLEWAMRGTYFIKKIQKEILSKPTKKLKKLKIYEQREDI